MNTVCLASKWAQPPLFPLLFYLILSHFTHLCCCLCSMGPLVAACLMCFFPLCWFPCFCPHWSCCTKKSMRALAADLLSDGSLTGGGRDRATEVFTKVQSHQSEDFSASEPAATVSLTPHVCYPPYSFSTHLYLASNWPFVKPI